MKELNKLRNPHLIMTNGLILAFRLFLVLIMGFYATRLALAVLGDVDFGIYSVVGGLISMFAIITLPLSATIQRYLNVELANDKGDISKVFCTAFVMTMILSLILFLAFELIGAPCVLYLLNIPIERSNITNWVYQTCILSSILALFVLPFKSLLYAKEEFGVCAYIELFFSFFKLVVVYFIPYIGIDYLLAYALLFPFAQAADLFASYYFVKKKMPQIEIRLNYDINLLKQMGFFSGWSFVESASGIILTYGTNILINIFGGVLFNTASGIAKQVSNAVNSFSINAAKAIEPQITSSQVVEDNSYRNSLLMISVKAIYILLGFMVVVFYFESASIFEIWLQDTPKYAIDFTIVMLLSCPFIGAVLPLRSLILATGRIKRYFIWYGVISALFMFAIFFILFIGCPVIYATILYSISSVAYLILALWELSKLTDFPVVILSRSIFIMSFVLVLVWIVYRYLNGLNMMGNWSFIINTIISAICIIILSYMLVFTKREVKQILRVIKK